MIGQTKTTIESKPDDGPLLFAWTLTGKEIEDGRISVTCPHFKEFHLILNPKDQPLEAIAAAICEYAQHHSIGLVGTDFASYSDCQGKFSYLAIAPERLAPKAYFEHGDGGGEMATLDNGRQILYLNLDCKRGEREGLEVGKIDKFFEAALWPTAGAKYHRVAV